MSRGIRSTRCSLTSRWTRLGLRRKGKVDLGGQGVQIIYDRDHILINGCLKRGQFIFGERVRRTFTWSIGYRGRIVVAVLERFVSTGVRLTRCRCGRGLGNVEMPRIIFVLVAARASQTCRRVIKGDRKAVRAASFVVIAACASGAEFNSHCSIAASFMIVAACAVGADFDGHWSIAAIATIPIPGQRIRLE